jgi:hypothetical protein
MSRTATYISNDPEMRGDARLYRVDPAMETYRGDSHEYVIVSAIHSAFDTGRSETFIFPANEHGDVVDWVEMPGSRRGVFDCEGVLEELGYTIV